MQKGKVCLLLFLFTVSLGCNREKLNHASEKGANTASWLVGGFACKTGNDVDGGPAVYAERVVTMDGTVLTINLRDGTSNIVYIKITGYSGPGVYQLNTLKTYALTQYKGTAYTNENTRTGYVNILRDDRADQILAGRFEFLAGGGSSTITITKGRFDIGQ